MEMFFCVDPRDPGDPDCPQRDTVAPEARLSRGARRRVTLSRVILKVPNTVRRDGAGQDAAGQRVGLNQSSLQIALIGSFINCAPERT